jgi:2-polyprenyl-6-methoxyphenol hydroxylase-like FAD-dependent oxidoreductase
VALVFAAVRHHVVASFASQLQCLRETIACHDAIFVPNGQQPRDVQDPDKLPRVAWRSSERQGLGEQRPGGFNVIMGANVRELVEVEGVVRGIRYQSHDGWQEVRALLTVGADGRFSRLRRLSSLPAAVKTSPPMDILWFHLSNQPGDPEGVMFGFHMRRGLIMLERTDPLAAGLRPAKGWLPAVARRGP